MKSAIIWIMLFHSPVLMDDIHKREFATESSCKAEARRENRRLGHGSLYYECIPLSRGEPVSMWFPKGSER